MYSTLNITVPYLLFLVFCCCAVLPHYRTWGLGFALGIAYMGKPLIPGLNDHRNQES